MSRLAERAEAAGREAMEHAPDPLNSQPKPGSEISIQKVYDEVRMLRGAVDDLTRAIFENSSYSADLKEASIEKEGRASLARWIVPTTISLYVAFAAALAVGHNGMPIGFVFAKGLCFLGALISAMAVQSGNDRWKFEQIALSNCVELEERRKIPNGSATSRRDAYETPTLMPARVNAAGVAATCSWLGFYVTVLWIYG